MTLHLTAARIARPGALLFVCLFALPQFYGPLAQQDGHSSSNPAIKISAVQVNVYVIAQDRHGRLIPSLEKENFELTDDGLKQQIHYFSRETNNSLSLGVLLDTSASQEHLLATEQRAANLFLDSVLQTADQAFVMRFDVDSEVLQDFTHDSRLLTAAVNKARINETGRSILPESPASVKPGGTHLYDAVYLASNELMKTRYGRKVLVLVTDGEDQGSTVKLRSAVEAAGKADVIIYSIQVNDPSFYLAMGLPYHGTSTLESIARETGGRDIRTQSVQDIAPAFARIASELRAQYLLGYTPSNMNYDGAFHRIRVSIPNHKYAIRTRVGYYAPTSD